MPYRKAKLGLFLRFQNYEILKQVQDEFCRYYKYYEIKNPAVKAGL